MPSRLYFEITGTHTGAANQANLTDASATFVTKAVQAGDIIYNVTDGSRYTIAAGNVTGQTTITTTLAGGVENDWDNGDSYRIWTHEVNVIRSTIRDTLYYPMQAEITIANPQNNREDIYTDYLKIYITENTTGFILFSGKVERSSPSWDPVYGQVVIVTARDNMQELLKRVANVNYAGYTRRSDIIRRLIANHTYNKASGTHTGLNNVALLTDASGNFLTKGVIIGDTVYNLNDNSAALVTGVTATTITAALNGGTENDWDTGDSYAVFGNINVGDSALFDTSDASEAAGVLDLDYRRSGKNVLRAIAELANEDPWDASAPTGYAFDYYLYPGTAPATAGGHITPDLYYFQRQKYPVGGASANGLTIAYGVTETAQRLSMLSDYGFTTESRELATIVRIEYMNTTGALQSLTCMLMDVTNVVGGPFTVGETINGTITGSATVEAIGSTYLILSDFGRFIIGDTITGVTSLATATISRIPRQAIEQDVEIVIRGYEASALGEARDRASQLLYHSAQTITRGMLSITSWPQFNTGTAVLVRTGHAVRVTNANVGINEDMIVTSIVYDEGPEIKLARVEVKGAARGKGVRDVNIENIAKDAETALWSSLASSGGIPSSGQLVRITSVFTAVDNDDISWGAGTAVYSDDPGSPEVINAGALNMPLANTIYYIYVVRGNATLQTTTAFATAVGGINNTLIAIALQAVNASEDAEIVSINGGSSRLVANTVVANQLSAITANMGLLTAGAIRIPSGTATSQTDAVLAAAGFTGFALTGEQIGGYSAGVKQVAIHSADGMLVAGGTSAGYAHPYAVLLDASGVHISSASANVHWHSSNASGYKSVGFQNPSVGAFQVVNTGAGTDITTFNIGSPFNTLSFGVSPFTFSFPAGASVQVLATGGNFSPSSGGAVDLGTATLYFSRLYLQDILFSGGSRLINPYANAATKVTFVTRNIADSGDVDHVFGPTSGNRGLLGDATYYWNSAYIDTINTQNVVRRSGAGGAVGAAVNYFSNGYFATTNTDSVQPLVSGGAIGANLTWYTEVHVGANYNYIAANGGDMSFYVRNPTSGVAREAMYISDNDPHQVHFPSTTDVWLDGNVFWINSGGMIDFQERATPGAPAADHVILYADDNGVGKTRLMALFSSGAAQQVAIQP